MNPLPDRDLFVFTSYPAQTNSRHRQHEIVRFKALAAWEREALQRVYDRASVTGFKFTENLLLCHVLNVGASGSHKTNQAEHIISELPVDASQDQHLLETP